MIFTLNILIELLLIAALYALLREVKLARQMGFMNAHRHSATIALCLQRNRKHLDRCRGLTAKLEIKTSLAEKMADRAFNMASSANLGVVALQKALIVPRLMTKPQIQQNQLAAKGVDDIFKNPETSSFDWLRPILSDEDNELLDKVEEIKMKELEKLKT